MDLIRSISQTKISRAAFLRVAAVAAAGAAVELHFGCGQQPQSHSDIPQGLPGVRVLLLENRTQVALSATAPPMLRVGAGRSAQLEISGGATLAVTLSPDGWRAGGVPFGAGELTVVPTGEGTVAIDGKPYRGQYRFVPKGGGKFDVVNDVDIDSYTMGVLSVELLKPWHEEAYRAQAITARTYALYVARTSSEGTHYDLFADTRSQVYGGIKAETAKSQSAVEATRGVVLACGPAGQERIFKAYFSSCCGGVTQSAAAAFGDPPCEALTEQDTGTRCAGSKWYSWAPIVIPKSELTRRVRIWGVRNGAPEKSIGDIARIDILSTNRFGRPESFAMTDGRGMRYRLASEDFRIAVDSDAGNGPKLFSSFCKPVNDGAVVRFVDGHGLGHGVGLCQYCAQAEALAGVGHEQIVLDAFPKSALVTAY